MDERLIKQWEVIKALLAEAARQIESSSFYGEYADYISHNELELALDVLEAAGEEVSVNRDYWWNIKKAAEVMGLLDRLNTLRAKLREAGHEDS